MILLLDEEFYHYYFGRFNSCTKNLPLNDFTLAWRIYRWTILLLHEEFIVERFYSYMKNFIIISLDDLILAQRIYRWTILLLHEEFIIEFLGRLLLEWTNNHAGQSCSFFGNFIALGLLETMLDLLEVMLIQ